MNELDAPRAPTNGRSSAHRVSDIPEAPSRLEPATQRLIDGLAGVPPLYTLSPQAAHQALTSVQSQPVALRPADITDMEWPVGPTGTTLVRAVRPAGVTGTLPVLMYVHVGGWVLGDTVSHDRLVRELTEGVQAAVVFVDDINSPAAKYPTQNEQAYAAMVYAVQHAQALEFDASRLAVAGDSVGGNMSVVITLLAKERGGTTISQQVLLCPLLDYLSHDSSYQKFGEGPWLIATTMRLMLDLMDMDGTEDHHTYPLRATVGQLRGFPETPIVTDDDILQDEGEAYASTLGADGVRVTSVRSNQTVHDLAMLDPLGDTPATRSIVCLVVATLRDALYPHT